MITKFDLKTPGREDDDLEAEKNVTLANNNFTQVAEIVLAGIGGRENVTSLDNCITRLRFEVKDYTKVDEKKIKSAGVAGVIRPSKNAVQVIVGTKVQFVADEMKKCSNRDSRRTHNRAAIAASFPGTIGSLLEKGGFRI